MAVRHLRAGPRVISAEVRVFRYVVPRDFGFAPNPFFGVCTLATCKPEIRRKALVGDLIVGINGRPPSKRPKQHIDRLVYLMRVAETVTFDQYWQDAKFQRKKPDFQRSRMYAYGDNIYRSDARGNWIQADSHHSYEDGEPNEGNIRTDTQTNRVLIAKDFVYWGGQGPTQESINDLPWSSAVFDGGRRGEKSNFDEQTIAALQAWFENILKKGFQGKPERWIAGAA